MNTIVAYFIVWKCINFGFELFFWEVFFINDDHSFFFNISDQSFKFCPYQCFHDWAGTWYSSNPGEQWFLVGILLVILNLFYVYICFCAIAVWLWPSAIVNQFINGKEYGVFDRMHGWLVTRTTKGYFSSFCVWVFCSFTM